MEGHNRTEEEDAILLNIGEALAILREGAEKLNNVKNAIIWTKGHVGEVSDYYSRLDGFEIAANEITGRTSDLIEKLSAFLIELNH